MRDRQPIASVSQLEVIDATCSSAQVPPAISIVNITPEPIGIFNPTFNPGFSPPLNNLPPPQQQLPSLPIQPMPDFSQLPYPAISQPPPPFSPPGTTNRSLARASLHTVLRSSRYIGARLSTLFTVQRMVRQSTGHSVQWLVRGNRIRARPERLLEILFM